MQRTRVSTSILSRVTIAGLAGIVLAAAVLAKEPPASGPPAMPTVSLRKLADCLHAVIAADRDVYVREVIDRLALSAVRTGSGASELCLGQTCLPVHARMLRMAAARVQAKGAEFSYALRSLWPIDESQGPQTGVEQLGLQRVARNQAEPFYSEETLGGRRYYTAVYPDVATLRSCIDCHNRNPSSPRHDFRPGDVMGAIVVRVPLEF